MPTARSAGTVMAAATSGAVAATAPSAASNLRSPQQRGRGGQGARADADEDRVAGDPRATLRLTATSDAGAGVVEKSSCSSVPSFARRTQVLRLACRKPVAAAAAGRKTATRAIHGARKIMPAPIAAIDSPANWKPNRRLRRIPAGAMLGVQSFESTAMSLEY